MVGAFFQAFNNRAFLAICWYKSWALAQQIYDEYACHKRTIYYSRFCTIDKQFIRAFADVIIIIRSFLFKQNASDLQVLLKLSLVRVTLELKFPPTNCGIFVTDPRVNIRIAWEQIEEMSIFTEGELCLSWQVFGVSLFPIGHTTNVWQKTFSYG